MTDSNHELLPPQFTPRLNDALKPLCKAIPPENITDLVEDVTRHVKEIKTALRKNEFLDVSMAKAIAHALLEILPDYGQYSEKQQALIVGAAKYFIQEGDVEPDTSSVLGLDDDAEVLNYVLEVIDRPDLKVEV